MATVISNESTSYLLITLTALIWLILFGSKNEDMFFQRHKRDIPFVQKKTKRFAFDPSDAFVKCEAREKYAVLSSRVQFPLLQMWSTPETFGP